MTTATTTPETPPAAPAPEARAVACEALMTAWHEYLATLTPAERWARLA